MISPIKSWALTGKYLLKALADLKEQNIGYISCSELCGYNIEGLNKAVKEAYKLPKRESAPTDPLDLNTNPDYNFIPDYFVINDFLAHTIYEEGILYMTKECFNNNYIGSKSDLYFDWRNVDNDHLKNHKLKNEFFSEPMVYLYIDALIYVDGREVEMDEILKRYGNLKRFHLKMESFSWQGKSYISRANPSIRTPLGISPDG
tara:strand:+ start:923 stop:1531 length:609 start_codon:yes stop_codon:yes gene_type:complete